MGHRDTGDTMPATRRRTGLAGAETNERSTSHARCRQCDKLVYFTTHNGKLLAMESGSWRQHPCENP